MLILGVTTIASLLKTRSDNKKDDAAGITRDGDGNVIDATAAVRLGADARPDARRRDEHDGTPQHDAADPAERAPKA